jgi:hypothetical protein
MLEVERPAFRGAAGAARAVTVAGLAGVIAGIIVGGVGGRLFMRLAAVVAGEAAQGVGTEAGFTVGELTLEGTVSLLLFVGVSSGLVGAAWFVIFRPWLGWAGRWRGAVFGVLLFALASATSDVLNPDNVDFRILGNGPTLVVSIAALFVGFGLLIEPAASWLDRRLPVAGTGHPIASAVYGATTTLGVLMGSALLLQALFTTNFCDCDPPVTAAVGTVAAAAGTALWMASGIRDVPIWVSSVARILGLGGLAVATAGLVRALADAASVVTA